MSLKKYQSLIVYINNKDKYKDSKDKLSIKKEKEKNPIQKMIMMKKILKIQNLNQSNNKIIQMK